MATLKYLRVKVSLEGVVEADDGKTQRVSETYEQVFTDGNASGKADGFFYDETRSLAATSEDLQLDSLDATYCDTLADVRVLYIRNLDEDAGDTFSIGGSGGGNAWDSGPLAATHEIVVAPGGMVLIVDPTGSYTVSAGDDLEVTAADTSTYRALIAGGHA